MLRSFLSKSCLFILGMILFFSANATEYILQSPDGKIQVKINVDNQINWSVLYGQEILLQPSRLSMSLSNGANPGVSPIVQDVKTRSVKQVIEAIVPVKAKLIPDEYNETRLSFNGNYTVVFRAYNDGVAYRFETAMSDTALTVNNETAQFKFSGNNRVFWSDDANPGFQSHFESLYKDSVIAAFKSPKHAALPLLLSTKSGVNMLISESDLYDYPNMFLFGTGGDSVIADFPKVILERRPQGDRGIRITKLADYIAKTTGTRTYPWRSIAICKDDKGLLENNLTYKLATPNVLTNTSWIKPGKVAWDWWNANNIYGVNFKAGLNTETYKYYIDFAAAYGLDYIMLDEGWTKTTRDIMHSRPEIDIEGLIKYATSKKVGVILWVLWNALDENLDAALDQFVAWGAKGIKVDFMARADQEMVNMYERWTIATAKRKLLIDLHGAYKPVGLNRKYPNVISYEGVRGAENNKWENTITPAHNTTLPFTRMAAGPMDYTPGAMKNATKENFAIVYTEPMSMGTRAHQVAMYVAFESPLMMLADNPSNYMQDPACTRFIAQIPTVWDTTIALEGKVSEYLATARKKGNKWYIGAMTNWTARDWQIPLSFLVKGKKYRMQVLKDGINAERHASDYVITQETITGGQIIPVKLAKGGGWCAVIEEVK